MVLLAFLYFLETLDHAYAATEMVEILMGLVEVEAAKQVDEYGGRNGIEDSGFDFAFCAFVVIVDLKNLMRDELKKAQKTRRTRCR